MLAGCYPDPAAVVFRRATNNNSSKDPGLPLDAYLSEILEAIPDMVLVLDVERYLKGTVGFVSAEPGGTTFSVTLPKAAGDVLHKPD